MAQTTNYKRYF